MNISELSAEEAKILNAMFALAATDSEFRDAVVANPKEILKEAGVAIPDEINVVAYDTPPNTICFALPARQK